MKKIVVSSGLVILSLFLLVGVAGASLLTNGSFESPKVSDSKYSHWAVYGDVGPWYLLSGQGIEIQTNGTVVNAKDGDQYVELDSDPNRHVGGTFGSGSTNSAMGQDVTLAAGTYELSFWYRPRTNTSGDNGIAYGLWGNTGPGFTSTFGTADGISSGITDWEQITHTFEITNPGDFTIAFAASGTANKLGGFIDNVELNAVPIPGAVWLLGSGLLGLIGIRRKKKA